MKLDFWRAKITVEISRDQPREEGSPYDYAPVDEAVREQERFKFFMSQASEDEQQFTDELYKCLTNEQDLKVFYYKEDNKRNIVDKLNNAFTSSDQFLPFISPSYLQKCQSVSPNWVKDEFQMAQQYRISVAHQEIILPIIYNLSIEDVGKVLPLIPTLDCIRIKVGDTPSEIAKQIAAKIA